MSLTLITKEANEVDVEMEAEGGNDDVLCSSETKQKNSWWNESRNDRNYRFSIRYGPMVTSPDSHGVIIPKYLDPRSQFGSGRKHTDLAHIRHCLPQISPYTR